MKTGGMSRPFPAFPNAPGATSPRHRHPNLLAMVISNMLVEVRFVRAQMNQRSSGAARDAGSSA
jgi:hypothetical protein